MKKRIFVTGSTTGLGNLAAKALIEQGHDVFLHARNEKRAQEVSENTHGHKDILIGDLSKPNEIQKLAKNLRELGQMDSVIHNAGISYIDTPEYNELQMTKTFCVNVFAPYYLTRNIQIPKRLVYLSSDLHYQGHFDLSNLQFEKKLWNSGQAYNDSKLLLTMLAKSFSFEFKESFVNAVDPGWVPTRMGGKSATDDLKKGFETQVWLCSDKDLSCRITGKYFFHKCDIAPHEAVNDIEKRKMLLDYLSEFKI
ncbi:SDR family NAD(P)-dependent oxidoreductase [Halobacteriovorax sp. GB3]|uniref:SDR family NAD(P)-dependent oxidoreductase n=1 Tax=Halobacteriovorax sp. GB3 TaxID=2719615 RepID=UPI00235F9312|nr:SDR family NAD(P)-dependent oxidoreductase [Halobacteriovorax sp. GB3]MDD0851534.1 SDR family NAD(P)-dependent oxidoreductase [Halobacteriovorax sp. GB3]